MVDAEDDTDPDIDRTAQTPRTSESFTFFYSAAFEMSLRLENRFIEFLVDDRFEARRLISELQRLSERFGNWPALPAIVVAKERQQLANYLVDLTREAETLLAKLPSP